MEIENCREGFMKGNNMPMSHEEYLHALNWRYAVKRFDPTRKISDKDWNILAESLRLSPSSYGLQPWKFIVVQDPKLREELRVHSWNQSQVTDCSHYVVLTTLVNMSKDYIDSYIEDMAKTRSVAKETLMGFEKMLIQNLITNPPQSVLDWSHRQSYIAMGNIMTTAALFHIDACPMEGMVPAKYDEVLGLDKTDYRTVAGVALGYRHTEDKLQYQKKVRFPQDKVFEYR